jgi:MscS family membrane protein
MGLAGCLPLAVGASPAQAPVTHTEPAAAASPPSTEAALADDSPRASVIAFLEHSRAGRFADAARFLSAGASGGDDTAEAARHLKAVLDRHLWLDLESISGRSEGRTDDGLPASIEELGTVPGPQGAEPVRMVRAEDAEGRFWAFTSGTVARVDAWYAALGDRWLREHLPARLLRPGPAALYLWQWLALPLLIAVAAGGGRLLAWATVGLLRRVAIRTSADWDDWLLSGLRGPLGLAWCLIIVYLLTPRLGLASPAQAWFDTAIGAGVVVTVFWALWRAVDVAGHVFGRSRWGRESASARSVLAIGVRAGKIAVLGMGLVAGLSQLGYPVASLLAGLGLGGLALALAAQKTVEHLFGSLSLAVDQPFRVGDFVRVEDFVGTVEDIGLRSTRFRTLDRTVVSIPNGRVADMRLESLTARDRMRLVCTVGVVYGTSSTQLREVLAGLESVLRSHPRIWPDTVVVRFKELAASSLDIEVMAWFETPDWSEFQLIRQDVLLQFLEVVERAGTSFAFPTRTIHLDAQAQEAAAPPAR